MKSFIIVVILLSLTITAFAQGGNETITITTYYPSPYGVYRDLNAMKSFAVGNFTSQEVQNLNPGQLQVKESIAVGDIAASDVAGLKQGDLLVKGGLRLTPRTQPPLGSPGKEGELAYYDGNLYVHDGSSWKIVSGSSSSSSGSSVSGNYTPIAGTMLGAITITFEVRTVSSGTVTWMYCTRSWPGICVQTGLPSEPYNPTGRYEAGCESGWRVTRTGGTFDSYSNIQKGTDYYGCIKE